MIIGEILEDEQIIKLDVKIHCTSCGKQVPGGLKTGEKYYQTQKFRIELEEFLRIYLCGQCRDKIRNMKK